MVKFASGALLAGFVSLALVGTAAAQPAAPAVNDVEFKCMVSTNKAGSKFVGAKSKCISKCLQTYWKGDGPDTDCLPPSYGGATAQCIDDTSSLDKKGAEDKFRNAILKACDPATKAGTDCPECYSGGDCSTSGEATTRVQNIEGQIDSFVPGVACDRAGATPEEQKCELNTAKVLAKFAGALNKCYDKCFSNARKGLAVMANCDPNAATPDAALAECKSKAFTKSESGVNKQCRGVGESAPGANDGTVAVPDCAAGTNNYPDGTTWSNLVDLAVSGTTVTTYCASPSGAFVN